MQNDIHRTVRDTRSQLRRLLYVLVATCVVLGYARTAAAMEPAGVLVFGAASLTDVLDDLQQTFTAQEHIPVKASYAASSVLAKQIESGAPADVFFAADLPWMDYLEQRSQLRPGSRRNIVGNELVLIAPANSKAVIRLRPGVDLRPILGPQGKLATGDPESVPVGQYAEAALKSLGAWDQVSGRIARAENVRGALAFVARGEVPLGIVYRTDALAEKRVRILDEFPRDSHPPIEYPIALTGHAGTTAQKFVQFVASPAAAAVFRKYGFQPLHSSGL